MQEAESEPPFCLSLSCFNLQPQAQTLFSLHCVPKNLIHKRGRGEKFPLPTMDLDHFA